jgi:hypothetical protein
VAVSEEREAARDRALAEWADELAGQVAILLAESDQAEAELSAVFQRILGAARSLSREACAAARGEGEAGVDQTVATASEMMKRFVTAMWVGAEDVEVWWTPAIAWEVCCKRSRP